VAADHAKWFLFEATVEVSKLMRISAISTSDAVASTTTQLKYPLMDWPAKVLALRYHMQVATSSYRTANVIAPSLVTL
jgi:thiamine pyrophosphokinase